MSTQTAPAGIPTSGEVHRNLPAARLVEEAIARGEGALAANGALSVGTGDRTGRSPGDRFVVDTTGVHDEIWWGKVNVATDEATFDRRYAKVRDHLRRRDQFVFDGFAGADPRYRLPVRIVAEKAWHSLFARTLFVRPKPGELASHKPELTVINAC